MVTFRNFCRSTGGLLVLVSSSLVALQAQAPQPFAADFVMSQKQGQTATGKMYFAAPKIRMEMTSRRQSIIVIVNGLTKTNYVVMPHQHMYMESRFDQPNPMMGRMPRVDGSFDPRNPCPDGTCKKVGTETLNGRVCDKWEFTDKNGSSRTAWIDQRLYFPIKNVNADGTSTEFSNIKEGPQDAFLFEVPAGYQKIDLGGMGRRPQP